MARTSLTAASNRENGQVERFQALEMEKGHVARLWVPPAPPAADGSPQPEAWMEYVHTIKAPAFGEDDKPVMGTKTTKNGSKTVYETDFIGRPICLGDPETLKAEELDAERCPVCAGVKRMLDAGIGDALDLKAQRRYAVPVIRYNTVTLRSADKLQTPLGARVLVWGLSQWTRDMLDAARAEGAEFLDIEPEAVKLPMVDFAVEAGPWKVPVKINPKKRAVNHEMVRDFVRALWGPAENRPTDEQLRAACGREPNRDWMRRDIEGAEFAWDKAVNGAKPGPAGNGALSGGGQSLEDSLDDLLGGAAPSADPLADHPGGLEEFAGRPAAAPPADDLFGAGDAAPVSGAKAAPADDFLSDPAPAAAPAPNGAKAASGAQSFDDIFDGIGA